MEEDGRKDKNTIKNWRIEKKINENWLFENISKTGKTTQTSEEENREDTNYHVQECKRKHLQYSRKK